MTAGVRLGIIVPSVNSVVEAWYPRVVPARVSVHFARMLMSDATSPERIVEMDRTDGARAIKQLASCRPHAVAYGCTASSVVQGHAFDARLRTEIRHITGAPGTSATNSFFAACAALGLKRVTAISPYPETVDAAEYRFFAEGGVETVSGAWLGIADAFRLAEPHPAAILDLALGGLESGERRDHHRLPQLPLAPDHRGARAADRQTGRHLDPGNAVARAAPGRARHANSRLRPAAARTLTQRSRHA